MVIHDSFSISPSIDCVFIVMVHHVDNFLILLACALFAIIKCNMIQIFICSMFDLNAHVGLAAFPNLILSIYI
jgi:hypothetical protein